MLKLLKSSLLFLFIITLSACSYSPDSLKENYKELASEVSQDLKAPFDLSAQQNAMIDDYSKELFKWHRRNKLPAYSQNFAVLAREVQQQNPDLLILKNSLVDFSKIPHLAQATHLTPKIIAFSKSLNNRQIVQLEQFFNDEYQSDKLEIKRENYTAEIINSIKGTFQFLEVPLNTKQLKIVTERAKQFHDIRYDELNSNKLWGQKTVALLKQKNQSSYNAKFASLWKTQDANLTGKALKLHQQNATLFAKLIKKLLINFTAEERNQLANKLLSISNTLSEMANE